ncbi:hypothetical protein EYB45_01385 [Erythrobacteraceae bacterium CFH 75059]|uniref:hypothetical protein n=1 Tax=Qipengyuania thermophila TaxID=2509361 RepID=UPI001020B2F3|nr:hypothetical protein [Qipengyuania thermophila]TCD06408.1 hypothetical protein EYB45_01385 [Erythrobacteraceae bacterium CFH 75059]
MLHALFLLAAAAPQLSPLQQGALTCAAAFAVDAGQPGAEVRDRSREREFFVQVLAQIMDETGADRAAIAGMASAEARRLADTPGELERVLPPCRMLLPGPAAR